jgi:hypothetical protein
MAPEVFDQLPVADLLRVVVTLTASACPVLPKAHAFVARVFRPAGGVARFGLEVRRAAFRKSCSTHQKQPPAKIAVAPAPLYALRRSIWLRLGTDRDRENGNAAVNGRKTADFHVRSSGKAAPLNHEGKGDPIVAVTLAGRFGAIVEDVSLVAATARAMVFGARIDQLEIGRGAQGAGRSAARSSASRCRFRTCARCRTAAGCRRHRCRCRPASRHSKGLLPARSVPSSKSTLNASAGSSLFHSSLALVSGNFSAARAPRVAPSGSAAAANNPERPATHLRRFIWFSSGHWSPAGQVTGFPELLVLGRASSRLLTDPIVIVEVPDVGPK